MRRYAGAFSSVVAEPGNGSSIVVLQSTIELGRSEDLARNIIHRLFHPQAETGVHLVV
jgi:hypothetical protein